jgi:PAS domain S-box-containing protein
MDKADYGAHSVTTYPEKYEKTDDVLRESDERFKSYIENAPDGIFLADENGNYTDVNPAAERITGYSRAELLKMNLTQLIPPNAISESLKHFEQVVAEGEATGDYPFITKDGSLRYWTVKAVRLDKNRFLGFVTDITERREIEQELIRAKETAEKYLNLAGSIILSLDSHANITLINQKGLDILEYTRDELIGKNWFDVCLPISIKEKVKQVFASIISGAIESLDHYENEVVTKSGKIRLISWFNTILRNQDMEIEGILSSGEDITDRKETEKELIAYHERLEELVRERTVELKKYNKLFIGREFRIKELREKVKELEKKLNA